MYGDLRGVIWFMWFGIICAALLIVVGIPAAAWWAWNHLSIHINW